MAQVLALALPFFGLIFLGFFCGKIRKLPEEGLAWMNFFIIYVALPCLFFKLIATTPFEQLSNWPFILSTTVSTYIAFALSFAVGIWVTGGDIKSAAIQGALGGYSNVGYMGPGITLAAVGPAAAVPTALVFVFDCILFFTIVPFMMGLGGAGKMKIWSTAKYVVLKVVTHPFNIATAVAVIAAYFHWQPPEAVGVLIDFLARAAAPCALFALGVTVALRPYEGVPVELPIHLFIKLLLHPVLVWVILSAAGDFDRAWVFTAMLMASLPPAGNVFVMARQFDVYVQRASNGVLVGTIVSVATVTLFLYLIAGDIIPYDLFPSR
ncbi:MAG: AEC family transporter [Methylocystis sp.]|nr:AEC family transporter [Methylocystis sp.]MCA3584017.1 AEC family transporter [Methylocystis sp.]MCA3586661.1 AEC family transporter [Methylocystis sp.]MCA3591631.1 AEC family transporter [Methylocystis sp.]